MFDDMCNEGVREREEVMCDGMRDGMCSGCELCNGWKCGECKKVIKWKVGFKIEEGVVVCYRCMKEVMKCLD